LQRFLPSFVTGNLNYYRARRGLPHSYRFDSDLREGDAPSGRGYYFGICRFCSLVEREDHRRRSLCAGERGHPRYRLPPRRWCWGRSPSPFFRRFPDVGCYPLLGLLPSRPFGSHHFPLFLLLFPRGRCWWFLGSDGRKLVARCSVILCRVSGLFNRWSPKRSSIALNMEGLISSTLLLPSRGGRSDSEAEPLYREHSCAQAVLRDSSWRRAAFSFCSAVILA
jgi:hypothetical protein